MQIQFQMLIDHTTTAHELNEYCIILSLLCSLLLMHDAAEDQADDNNKAEDGEDAKADQTVFWLDSCRRK